MNARPIDIVGDDQGGELISRRIRTMPVAIAPGDVADSHHIIESDNGSGSLLHVTITDDNGPSIAGIFGPTEQHVIDAASVANAPSWESATSALAPNKDILDAMSQSAGKGGVNMPLGPQLGFAPASSTTTTSGGFGGILFVALGIVGVLAYLHFRKKKEPEKT